MVWYGKYVRVNFTFYFVEWIKRSAFRWHSPFLCCYWLKYPSYSFTLFDILTLTTLIKQDQVWNNLSLFLILSVFLFFFVQFSWNCTNVHWLVGWFWYYEQHQKRKIYSIQSFIRIPHINRLKSFMNTNFWK